LGVAGRPTANDSADEAFGTADVRETPRQTVEKA
jgi:hypothetical protein